MTAGVEAGPASGTPEVVPFGDSAVLIVLGDRLDLALNRRARALAAAAQASLPAADGWLAPVPGHASLLLPYDPARLGVAAALAAARALLGSAATPIETGEAAPAIEISVRYGGDDGPDLAEVAERCGLSEAQVVELHAAPLYEVLLLGFAPGFAYLGLLPPQLVLPRRAEPRPRVPPGSVAIAGEQTAVYPLVTPGGWHLLGRTDAPLWDARRDPPALLRPGDRVRFVPTSDGGG